MCSQIEAKERTFPPLPRPCDRWSERNLPRRAYPLEPTAIAVLRFSSSPVACRNIATDIQVASEPARATDSMLLLAWCLSAMRSVKAVLIYRADTALDDALQRAAEYAPILAA